MYWVARVLAWELGPNAEFFHKAGIMQGHYKHLLV